MAQPPGVSVGLDVGGSKICVVAGRATDDLGVEIVGVATSKPNGFSGGVVIDIESAARAIASLLETIEVASDLEIDRVRLALPSALVESVVGRGVIEVADPEVGIAVGDIRRAIDAARSATTSQEQDVLYVLPQAFLVDGEATVAEPLDRLGRTLEVRVLVVTAPPAPLEGLIHAVNRAGVEIAELSLASLATSRVVLSADERDRGVCLINIGAAATDIAEFSSGQLLHTASIPMGGDAFTTDLAEGLRLPWDAAERLKCEHGHAFSRDVPAGQITRISGVVSGWQQVRSQSISDLLQPRAEELFRRMLDELRRAGLEDFLELGVVLAGGGSMLRGMLSVAASILRGPVRRGMPKLAFGAPSFLGSPVFATGLGLVASAQREDVKVCLPIRPTKPVSTKLNTRTRDKLGLGRLVPMEERLGATRSEARTRPPERVHICLTGPAEVASDSSFVLDVWAHLEAQRPEVERRARAAQVAPKMLLREQGPIQVLRGTVLDARLKLDGFVVTEPAVTIRWEGEIASASFLVSVPRDTARGQRTGTVRVSASGLEIARLNFVLVVGPATAPPDIVKATVGYHRTAFASYASDDRDTVLHIVQGMQKAAPGLDVFVDVAHLRSGDHWAQRLEKEIPQRDVFYLFWSESASHSMWVDREWRCAYHHRGIDFIDPVPLVSPSVVPPPAELAALHFNDWVLAYVRQKSDQV